MADLLSELYFASLLFIPPLLIGIWFLGLRRYIHKKGKSAITAASWGLSMWADWTEAWEIGRAEGKIPFSAKAFLAVHILVILELISAFVI